jgi:hypothetical protein
MSLSILRNSTDPKKIADNIILYFRSEGNLTIASNTSDILSPYEVDKLIGNLNNVLENERDFFIMAQSTVNENGTILGALSRYPSSNQIIQGSTKSDIVNSNFTAAAIVPDQSLNDITSIKMFIVNTPTAYKNLNSSNNQFLTSTVIVFNADKINNDSIINVNLYFKVLTRNEDINEQNGQYLCSFLGADNSWNQSGCKLLEYNDRYDRYECICNHFTTFALIWLPNISQPSYLTPQDIASLVFLSTSILCFIAVIIHSLTTRFFTPMKSLEARDLLPLISSASTMLVFIFYIALTMTIYTRISSPYSTPTPCFKSASVLMFFVYFFIIFMFCIKTSVGYFNYLRFIHLFPQPSNRKLFILLIISFFISITWTSLAAGFNSNSSFDITQLHGNKLCWFTRDVIYYYMTIPISIFLLLNFITIILVGKRIISHARNATSPHQSYQRMKRCILVLLSSCITQGIGWLFGPFITFINPTAADVLGWFFIIFNGLEGVWTILLYLIIRSQRVDEPRQVSNKRRRMKKTSSSSSIKNGKVRKRNGLNNVSARRFRNSPNGPLVFYDLYDEQTIDWETNTSEL